jgi:ATP-dependent protease ClpP protease subunit
MAIIYTPKSLCNGQLLTGAIAILYTVPASTITILKEIVLTNQDAAQRAVTLHIVPNGGSVSSANMILPTLKVDANNTLILALSTILGTPGDTIQAFGDVTNKISVRISGVEGQ